MRDVDLGLSAQYDDGVKTNVAINNNTILEVHESQGFNTLWYHVGTPSQATVDWGESHNYDDGVTPAVALNNRNIAVEVHKSQGFNTLWYHVGTVSGKSVSWGGSQKYDDGVQPRVAINDAGVVVEVHKSQAFDTLWYHVGTVNGSKVDFGESHQYDDGVTPAVALNNQGVVVEVHKSQAFSTLWYRVGKVEGKKINWGPSRQYDDGIQPSVALTDDGLVIEVHRSQAGGTLWRRVGTISGNTIAWSGSMSFDDGQLPSVATNGRLAIQTHQSENFSTLWFSTSLVIDRARWMEQRLPELKDKTLKQLTLPASHDSGMYLGGLSLLGKTQDLSIYGQLADGIRYFDLRPKWSSGKLYISHGPITGPLLQDVLNDIKKFLSEGHKELAVFKFSHYDNFNDDVYKILVQQIHDTIGPWLYTSLPAGKRLADVNLGSYLASQGIAMVVCDGDYPVKNKQSGIWVYRDWSSGDPEVGDLRVFDQYADTLSYDTMKKDQFDKFAKYNGFCQNKKDVPCDLFLLSWTLTPPTAVWEASKPANRNLGQAITELAIPNSHHQIVNLVYVDYVEYARVTDVSLYLNHAPF
jgi:hypothetical protein